MSALEMDVSTLILCYMSSDFQDTTLQAYSIRLALEMPDSPSNEDLGMFMACINITGSVGRSYSYIHIVRFQAMGEGGSLMVM